MTKTWAVLGFELAYQVSRVSTRIYFAVFLVLAVVVNRVFINGAQEDGHFFNAPIITAAITIIASIVSLLVSAAVAGDAATRDVHARMEPLVYTTPISKAAYLGGRFLGAFAVTALLLTTIPIVVLIMARLPILDPQFVGPFRPAAHLSAYVLFALPNAFVTTAVLFGIAALSRHAIASYGGAAVLFFGSFFTEGFVARHLGQWTIAKLLDPLGFTTMRALWRSSNPLQRNTMLVPLDASLLANRLLWLGVGVSVLALVYSRFRFAHVWSAGAAAPALGSFDETYESGSCGYRTPNVHRAFGVSTRVRQLGAVAVRSLRELIASRAWWIVLVAAGLFVATGPELLEVELGTPGAATTARVASMYGASELALLITLLITLSAGELVWRERDARIDAIADVTPVPEWLSLLGKFLALVLMLIGTQAVFLIAGVIVQTMEGFSHLELGRYVQILYGFQFAGFLLTAALAMVVHVLLNQKYVGNVMVMLAFMGRDMAREIGIHHNLLLYGGAPEWSYSDMAGFGQLRPWLWFTFYWSGWALLFAVLTYLFWIRGQERGVRSRMALARRRLTLGPAAIGAVALAIVIGAGGFVFYNTNVLNRYDTDRDVEQRAADYERRYGQYAALAQPLLAAKKLHVEFYPERGAAEIRGQYRLENRTAAPIETIHLATHSGVETRDVAFDRTSRLLAADAEHGYRIYRLVPPMQAGESVRMNFQIVFEPRGFTNGGRDATVLHNGSWIEHRGEQTGRQRRWLPAIGYQEGRELYSAGIRAQYGLRARPDVRALEDVAARSQQQGAETIDFEAIVGTDPGQLGVAPGALRRTWIENGRRYSHYVTDAPIGNIYAIFSANYAVHRATWRDVAIEIFHHPGHKGNLDRMVRSVRAALDYHTRHYTPYPHRQIRLVEYPRSGGGLGLTAYPGLIKYSEGFALVRPEDDRREIDLPYAVMAHEIGHQWWGHQIVPANVEGAPLLTESLAWYSAMMVVDETLGRDHRQRLLSIMRSQYLGPHETRQVSLLRSVDDIDGYRLGPFAMNALRESTGEERVNAALRQLLAKFPPDRTPYPTSLDLYAELRAVTPPAKHSLLKDLFEEITFWDLRTKRVDVQPAGRGAYRVTLHIDAQKLKADAEGHEKRVPMNDPIDVAVFDAAGKPIYRQPHRIRSGEQTITITVPRAPARAGIDPDDTLLDREPEDNVTEVGTS